MDEAKIIKSETSPEKIKSTYDRLRDLAEEMYYPPLTLLNNHLALIKDLWENLTEETMVAEFLEKYPDKTKDEAKKEYETFEAQVASKMRKGIPTFIDFINSDSFVMYCTIFPDAPQYFLDMLKSEDSCAFLMISPNIVIALTAILPHIDKVLKRHHPDFVAGSVPFSELMPAFGSDTPAVLWDEAMQIVRGELSAEIRDKKQQSEIQHALSTDIFSASCVHPTSKVATTIFTRQFAQDNLKALADEAKTMGLVAVPVKNIGRPSQENLYVFQEGELQPGDRDILNAVSSLYYFVISSSLQNVKEGQPVRISLDSIYKTMRGRKDVAASKRAKEDLLAGLSRLQSTRVLILDKNQFVRMAEDGTAQTIKDRFTLSPYLPCKIGGETVNGNDIQFLEMSTTPPLLDMSLKSGQKITFNTTFLDVQEIDKKTGLPSGVHIPATDRRVAIRNHLARRVQSINDGFKKHKKQPSKGQTKYGLDNNVINLDNFFAEIDIPNNTKPSRKANQADISDQLTFLTASKYIDGWNWMQYNTADRKAGKRGYGRVKILPKGWNEYQAEKSKEASKKEPAGGAPKK